MFVIVTETYLSTSETCTRTKFGQYGFFVAYWGEMSCWEYQRCQRIILLERKTILYICSKDIFIFMLKYWPDKLDPCFLVDNCTVMRKSMVFTLPVSFTVGLKAVSGFTQHHLSSSVIPCIDMFYQTSQNCNMIDGLPEPWTLHFKVSSHSAKSAQKV